MMVGDSLIELSGREKPIIGIFGELGSGKTLFMVYLLFRQKRRGFKVASNINISFQDSKFRSLIDIDKYRDYWIGVDEVFQYIDSRMSQSGIVNILLTARKKMNGIIYTSQVLSSVDLRLRQITNLIVYCEKLQFPYFRFHLISPNGLSSLSFVIRFPREVYESYNTFEIINVSREEIRELLEKSLNYPINLAVEFLKRQIPQLSKLTLRDVRRIAKRDLDEAVEILSGFFSND